MAIVARIAYVQLDDVDFDALFDVTPSNLDELRTDLTIRRGRILADVLGSVRVSSVNYLCPSHVSARYEYLAPAANVTTASRHKVYAFALNLYNAQGVLPDLILQLLAVFRHLGTKHVYLAIFENGSSDRTKSDLLLFQMLLKGLGVQFDVIMDKSKRPPGMHRIEYLAGVRNQLVELVVKYASSSAIPVDRVVVLNDVFICANDILELLHQSLFHNADMTCASDFDRLNNELGFYDSWVMRDVSGDFISQRKVDDYIRDPGTNKLLRKGLPFQVYCCWNGATVMKPAVFLPPHNIRFRREISHKITTDLKKKRPIYSSCSGSEMSQLCLDMASHGFQRRIVVPRVKLAYKWEDYRDLHAAKMYPHNAPFPAEDMSPIKFRAEPRFSLCIPMDSAGGLNGQGRSPEGPIGWEKLNLN